MDRPNGWRAFFDVFAPKYEEEVFTKNTSAEVDFIVRELVLEKGCRILDVGCGTCRHSVELAKRGFAMTGIDISKGMLDQAGLACARAGVSVELVRADAVDFQLPAVYDAALCLCEGSFGLLSAGDDPFDRDIRILRNIHSALKPGGRLLMTVLNGLRMARKYTDKDVVEGRFDPLSLSETYPLTNLLPDASKDVTMREKGFTAGELVLMLKAAGFADISIGGGTAGNWGRRAPELDEFELMVFAAKS